VLVHPRVYASKQLAAAPRFLVTDDGIAPEYVRRVRAALLALGPRAAARRRTAAVLYGWQLLVEPSRSLEFAVRHGHGTARAKGAVVSQHRRLDARLVRVLPGTEPLKLTLPLRTVVDACLELPLIEAVVLTDSALRSTAVTLTELSSVAGRLSGVRDAARLRAVMQLVDPTSGSVLESVQRVRMVLAGVTGFTTQHVLRDGSGRYVLRVDFCFEVARLIVEVDGQKWHQDPVRDRRLDNALAALGWRVLRYTWQDVVHDHTRVLAEISAALSCTPVIHLGADSVAHAA
jgi:very-short-patch-repair endonuclease